jgi:hypothetical protein
LAFLLRREGLLIGIVIVGRIVIIWVIDLAANTVAALVVASSIEVWIAISVILRPVVDALVPIILTWSVDFASDSMTADVAAPRIEIGIAVPVVLRPLVDGLIVGGATGDRQQTSGDYRVNYVFHV